MFVVFGALLGIFKVEGLLMELGKILGRRLRGGAGLTGVFSNSLIGMVSGAPVANVAITGPFVLPYMNKSGYSWMRPGAFWPARPRAASSCLRSWEPRPS